jgi:hypothetical protein
MLVQDTQREVRTLFIDRFWGSASFVRLAVLLDDHLERAAIRRRVRVARDVRCIGDVCSRCGVQGNRSGSCPRVGRHIRTAALRERIAIGFEMDGTGSRRGVGPENPFMVRFDKSAVRFLSCRNIYSAFRCSHRRQECRARGSRDPGAEHKRQSEKCYRKYDRMKPAALSNHELPPSL